ncbi:unnamed protein product, partial [Didymodactylos carnosus]
MFYWHDEQKQAFQQLKKSLTEPPLLLQYPHPTDESIGSSAFCGLVVDGTGGAWTVLVIDRVIALNKCCCSNSG